MIAKSRGLVSAKQGSVNVALYVRVSTDRQAQKEDGSLDTQLDRLNTFVSYKRSQGLDWAITERLVEGEKDGMRHGKSAKNTKRPQLQKLLELARGGLIDVVVITKLDRISRSVVDFLTLIEELHRHGVEVVSLRENIDFTTPTGRMFVGLMVLLAQFERETTSARVKDKVQWRAEKGLPLGPPPIGYQMKDKMFEFEEPYATHVREMDAIYLDQESSDTVVEEFRKRGYRTPGGSFYAKPVICRMLRNEVYAGKKEYEGKLRDGQWKAIRPWEIHLQIQKLMDRNRERNRSSKRQPDDYVYLLQGLLRCGNCAHKMSPKPGTGRNGLYYPYYSCVGAEKSIGGSCTRRYVPAEALDHAVLEFLKELRLKPERLQAFAAKAQEFQSDTLGKLQEDLERTRERLGSVRSKLSRLADAIADGGKDVMTSLREKLKSLEAEREELEALEARCKADLESEKSQVVAVQDQARTLARFQDLVEKSSRHPERIKMLLPRFVDYVVWHSDEKGEGRLEVALFPDPIALAPEVGADDTHAPPERCFVGGSQVVRAVGLEPTTHGLKNRCSTGLSYALTLEAQHFTESAHLGPFAFATLTPIREETGVPGRSSRTSSAERRS